MNTSVLSLVVTLKTKRRYSMSEFKKLAHAVWQCKYHIAFCPKYRFKILKGAVRESVKEFITQLCGWKKLEILEMNVQEDHVHLVLSIPPKYSVSEVIGFLKGKCAIKMFDRHMDLKKRYWGRHFWAKGYCVSTVGLDEEKIRKYVKWQHKKDKNIDQLKLWQ
jgi:putative transposase